MLAWEVVTKELGSDEAERRQVVAATSWDAIVAVREELPETHVVASIRRTDD